MDYRQKKINYILVGRVVRGKGKGKEVGMPTVNLDLSPKAYIPKYGVYGSSLVVNGKKYRGITNIGTRPSVDKDESITIETYLLDFSEDLYGERVALIVGQYIRGIIKFNSLEEVWQQVKKDIRQLEDNKAT